MGRPSRIIYVHGFGVRDSAPRFFTALNAFFRSWHLRFDLDSFAWDSLPRDIRTLVRNFLQSQEEAKQAGQALLERLLQLESQQVRYCLVGFSLGASVIRHMLDGCSASLQHLGGVYLLGAAFNCDEGVNDRVIPPEARCHNYFSPIQDVVLNTAYFNVTGVPAAGSKGLTAPGRFLNLITRCSHGLVHNYSALAPAIGFVLAWDDDQHLAGEPGTNAEWRTMGGKVFWDEICHHHDHMVQQNTITKHFRAIEKDPPRRRKAWGRNLHAVLRAV